MAEEEEIAKDYEERGALEDTSTSTSTSIFRSNAEKEQASSTIKTTGTSTPESESALPTQPPLQPYTVFSNTYRWYTTVLLGYICMASSLTANLYLPLIQVLATQYHTSLQNINLTITIYLIFQGISPSLWSPISDTFGRRPIYLLTFTIYTFSSLALVLTLPSGNYASLAILRALQSTGGSAAMSLMYSSMSDMTTHAERGKYLVPMMTTTNLGPVIGPLIGGGVLSATGDATWAFWTLFLFGVSSLLLIGCTMRETNRLVVGNGSVPAKGVWRTWSSVLVARRLRRKVRKNDGEDEVGDKGVNMNTVDEKNVGIQSTALDPTDINFGKTGKGKFKAANPLASLTVLIQKDAFTILCLAALPYGSWYMVPTSIPLIYGIEYGFSSIIVGVCYIAGGGGIIIGGWITGRLMDMNYKHAAKEAGTTVDKKIGDDMKTFPIERARSRGSYVMVTMTVAGYVGYGWAVEKHVHVSVPLILQCYLGCMCTILHQVYSALLVDVFQDRPGSAGAANNICRCAVSAAAVAAMQPLVNAIGRGWFFTAVGLLQGVGSFVGIYVLRRWVPKWRMERLSNLHSINE